ncbi:DNA-binding transcriptional MerR regulator [Clostridium punense]|uniref:DNA-binding transcriptional MerR regulator n=1 Tax=Clostridium punense TaxID=1054297 RepID=A0ABS4K6U3_9CLOT|nr:MULTISPECIES: helix-turn-helix domain-containing protein [Clostridium]EQB87333.1 hypothetical protein M918_09550 [Clostridium sp. BL8]MBP2023504.1 DNA-binding transcriptional MerR regulator [Clostridium punense]
MDYKTKYIDAESATHKIQNKKRGEISYYSIEQVSDLLNEDISNIRYYTKLFDDLLKIEIVGKELRYTNMDVDKLEFLIRLKNRGMSLKEIQEYYNTLPLNDVEVQGSESNLLSVEELICSIKKENQAQLNEFKAQLINDMKNDNLLYLEKIISTILEAQNKEFNRLKENLVKEVNEKLNEKFDEINEININLNNKFIDNTTEVISEKIDAKNHELRTNFQKDFNEFVELATTNNERLIKEVKDFKRVMQEAYYTQYDIAMESANNSFLNKISELFRRK